MPWSATPSYGPICEFPAVQYPGCGHGTKLDAPRLLVNGGLRRGQGCPRSTCLKAKAYPTIWRRTSDKAMQVS